MATIITHRLGYLTTCPSCAINIWVRQFSTTDALLGRRNIRKFPVANMVGQYDYRHIPKPLREKEFDYPLSIDPFNQRYPGYWIKGKFNYVKEMEPELIVPDLTDCQLKPYVSHRTKDIEAVEIDAYALFNILYADDIIKRYRKGEKVKVEFNPDAAEQSRLKHQQTGADMFVEGSLWSIDNDPER